MTLIRNLLWITAAAQICSCYKYNFVVDESELRPSSGQALFSLTEGQMFQSHDGPFGTDGPAYIAVSVTATVQNISNGQPANQHAILHLAWVDYATVSQLGSGGAFGRQYCCSPQLYAQQRCGQATSIGGLITTQAVGKRAIRSVHADINATEQRLLAAFQRPSDTINDDLSTETERLRASRRAIMQPFTSYERSMLAGVSVEVGGSFETEVSGEQYLFFVVCDATSSQLGIPPVSMSINVEFYNPYGYTPGRQYGYLPFYGTMFVLYLLGALAYSGAMIVKRRYLIRLQYCVVAVIFAGVVEMALVFFVYLSKNSSGLPTPCEICGSPSSDYLAALVWGVIKKAVSRGLLLAVAFGFGVVFPTLSKRAFAFIGGLVVLYFIFAVAQEIERETTYEIGPSAWELPVLILDLVFIIGTYSGLSRLRMHLVSQNEQAKLSMYVRLFRVLIGTVIVWFLVGLLNLAVGTGSIRFPWTWLFFLSTFWDLLYFIVLAAVAIIWIPGEQAYQYTWYSQNVAAEEVTDTHVHGVSHPGMPDNDNDDFGGGPGKPAGGDGLELTNIATRDDATGSFHNAAAHNFAIDEDDDDNKPIVAEIAKGKAAPTRNTNNTNNPATTDTTSAATTTATATTNAATATAATVTASTPGGSQRQSRAPSRTDAPSDDVSPSAFKLVKPRPSPDDST